MLHQVPSVVNSVHENTKPISVQCCTHHTQLYRIPQSEILEWRLLGPFGGTPVA